MMRKVKGTWRRHGRIQFKTDFEAEIRWDEDARVYVVHCSSVGVYSQAPTVHEATAAISEAVKLYIDGLVSLDQRKERHEAPAEDEKPTMTPVETAIGKLSGVFTRHGARSDAEDNG